MPDPTFGIAITQVDNEPRPAVYADMSVVGLVGTAPAADAAAFPLDTPVFMFSDDAAKLEDLGLTGTLRSAVNLINQQLGEFQVAAKIVVVRVQEGANADATIANIVGNGTTTGLSALLSAGSVLGHTPRMIAAPGFTSQTKNGVISASVSNGGSGYTTAPTVALTGGGGTGATATAQITVDATLDAGPTIDIHTAGSGVTYQSSDSMVASVSEDGLVTALTNGTAEITARYGEFTATVPVTVSGADTLQGITFWPVEEEEETIPRLGATVQLQSKLGIGTTVTVSFPAME